MKFVRTICLSGFVGFVSSCTVESGKLPVGTNKLTSEIDVKTRGEIKSALTELNKSIAMINKVQNVIQRGLAERDLDTGSNPSRDSLLAPSESDTLTFDTVTPERFEYRLTNSTSLSLNTRAGGKIQVLLIGTLDDTGEAIAIKDARLEVVHETSDGNQVFKILYEKNTLEEGLETTEWSIDFRQLSNLYRAMGGDDEAIAALSGSLEVRISKFETSVTANDFSLTHKDLVVVFEKVDIQFNNELLNNNKIVVKGYVDQGTSRRGSFAVSKDTRSNSTEFNVIIDI